MARRERPLKYETIVERQVGAYLVRCPLAAQAEAERAAAVMAAIEPVVSRYLGVPLDGLVRLDLLAEARASGVNPAVGVIRHALLGFRERSPHTAGLLGYQLGQILWYRGSREAEYRGPAPRSPDWLVAAALLPLRHIWSDGERWRDHLAGQLSLFVRQAPLPAAALDDLAALTPQQRALATAQCLLRGRSLEQRYPQWVRDLLALLADDVGMSGVAALEQLTAQPLAVLERQFAEDLEGWRRTLSGAGDG